MEYENNINSLNAALIRMTGIPPDKRKKLKKWFTNQNLLVEIEIAKMKRDCYFSLQSENKNVDKSVLEITAQYQSYKYYYELASSIKNKNSSMSLHQQKKLNDYLIKKSDNVKVNIKEEYLLNRSAIVNELLEKGKSFRYIAKFLKGTLRKNISHTYVRTVIKKYPNIFIRKDG